MGLKNGFFLSIQSLCPQEIKKIFRPHIVKMEHMVTSFYPDSTCSHWNESELITQRYIKTGW